MHTYTHTCTITNIHTNYNNYNNYNTIHTIHHTLTCTHIHIHTHFTHARTQAFIILTDENNVVYSVASVGMRADDDGVYVIIDGREYDIRAIVLIKPNKLHTNNPSLTCAHCICRAICMRKCKIENWSLSLTTISVLFVSHPTLFYQYLARN